jgi:outer membrane protein
MKKIALLFVVLVFTFSLSFSQKICHVDSEYILEKIPAYTDAEAEIEELAKGWQAEIEQMYQQVDSLYKIYQKEEVLLTEEMKIKKQDEIIDKEAEAKQLQQKYFGVEGEMYEKRQELVKPIQDNVYNALVELATEGGYDYIFDVVTGEILYASDTKDESDSVLKKLGY